MPIFCLGKKSVLWKTEGGARFSRTSQKQQKIKTMKIKCVAILTKNRRPKSCGNQVLTKDRDARFRIKKIGRQVRHQNYWGTVHHMAPPVLPPLSKLNHFYHYFESVACDCKGQCMCAKGCGACIYKETSQTCNSEQWRCKWRKCKNTVCWEVR